MNPFDAAFDSFRRLLCRLAKHLDTLFAVCLPIQIALCIAAVYLALLFGELDMVITPVLVVASNFAASPKPKSSPRLFFEARLGVISCATALSLIAALGNFAVAMAFMFGGVEIESWEVGGSLHSGLVFLMLGLFRLLSSRTRDKASAG